MANNNNDFKEKQAKNGRQVIFDTSRLLEDIGKLRSWDVLPEKTDPEVFKVMSDRGFSLIRLAGKIPIDGGWQKACTKRVEYDPKRFNGFNAGIACGPASGVLVLDVDDLEKVSSYVEVNGLDVPETFTVATGREAGAIHLSFLYPDDGKKYGCAARKPEGFEVKGFGGQVVCPGSVHPDSHRLYRVLYDAPIAPAPKWLLDISHGVQSENSNASMDQETFDKMKGKIAPCIAYILTENPKTASTTFNLLVMNLVKYFIGTGFTLDGALQLSSKFLQNYPHSESYTKPQAREAHFKAQWIYHEKHPDNRFSCSFIKGMNFSGSAFDCRECPGSANTDSDEPIQDPESWPILEPAAIYDGFIKKFINAACKHSEADPAAVLMTFLSRVAVEMGGSPYMAIGDGKQRLNLLVGVAGITAGGCKGTSTKSAKRLFRLEAPDYKRAMTTPGPLSSGEGIIYAVRDEIRTWVIDKKTQVGTYVVTDPGEPDKRLWVLTEELASAFRAMEREGNTLSTIVRQMYDDGNLAPLTKTNRLTATGAHIGVVGHITFFELEKLLEQNEIHNGLINRIMWCCSRRCGCIPFPEPIPDNEMAVLQAELMDILRYAQTVTRMTFSDTSKTLWAKVYPQLTASRGGIIGTILARAVTHVIRLSMIHALMDTSEEIETCHIEAALAVWRYCEQSARYIFESQGGENQLQKKILDDLKSGPKTATELSNHFRRNIPAKQIQAALKALIEQCKVSSFCENGKGRPVTKYILTK